MKLTLFDPMKGYKMYGRGTILRRISFDKFLEDWILDERFNFPIGMVIKYELHV